MANVTREYGLIGYPLGHSFSQKYFTQKFAQEGLTGYAYRNYEMSDISGIREWAAAHAHICGFNVTT
jgi:shikimate dehydrogenase